MVELIDHINNTITECSAFNGKYFGLCRLLKDDKGQVYPATYLNPKKVTPDDKWDVLLYHRLLDSSGEERETFSYGRTPSVLMKQRIRTVVVIKQNEPETVIDDIINSLPDKITNTDYKFVELSKSVTLIRDSQSIWESEWGTAYDDKYQLRFNLYALEYDLEYIKCTVCT